MDVALPVFLFFLAGIAVAGGMIVTGKLFGPGRTNPVKEMPYESGMDPFHDTHRRFDIRFHLVAISFLIFDVELLFLYPWAVASTHPEGFNRVTQAANASGEMTSGIMGREMIFLGVMAFIAILAVGLVYDWRKGVFRWQK